MPPIDSVLMPRDFYWVLDAASPKPELRECATCGEATTTEVCAYCRMVERVCRWKQRRVTPSPAGIPSPTSASTPAGTAP
ncbi:MAG: hypothetical protein HY684_01435 [Chloroflexi bacterium]|nr:hypothetical protein [Chloroflexota bacterium]